MSGGAGPTAARAIGRAILLMAVVAAAAPAQAGRAAFEEGMRLMRANQPAKAEAQFERAIAADNRNATYHLWLGNAVGQQAAQANPVRQGLMARRIRGEWERAVALDPALLDAREALVTFYLQAPGFMGGSVANAREQQREIASRAVIALAQRRQSSGRVAAAFAALDEALARHPRDIALRFQVGRLAAITGEQLPRAEQVLRALAAEPEWEQGSSRPSRAAVHFRLGMVLEKSGKRAEARTEYERAIALDPQLKAAQDALNSLR